jgi:hypothetical protein
MRVREIRNKGGKKEGRGDKERVKKGKKKSEEREIKRISQKSHNRVRGHTNFQKLFVYYELYGTYNYR